MGDAHAKAIAPQLRLVVDGRDVALGPAASTVRTRPGAGGLPTLYLTATYHAAIGGGAHRLVYRDATESGRLGWKDVVVGAQAEPTGELLAYPSALLGSPRANTAVAAAIDAAGRIAADRATIVPDDEAAASGAPAAPIVRSNALSDVLAKGSGDPLVVLGALLLAIALGALHALEPGHGKTLLAVSLVGARATPRQAVVLATALTAAHTAGVLALGVVVLAATRWIVPEQIYPWITLASGLFVTIIGARALPRYVRGHCRSRTRTRTRIPHAHPHAHDHLHAPGEDITSTPTITPTSTMIAHARAHAIPGTAPLRSARAVVAAASGNIAPCPAALVVLLAAISLHRIGYGSSLIVAFSVGLAPCSPLIGDRRRAQRGVAGRASAVRPRRALRAAGHRVVIAPVGAVWLGKASGARRGVSAPLVTALVLAAVVGYAFAWHQHRAPSEATA